MGNTIISAARNGAVDAIPELIAAAEDINRRGEEAKTALIIAAEKQDVEFVEGLLKYKPDLDLGDEGGLTAIAHACVNQDIDMIKLLKQAGADLYAAPGTEAEHALREAIDTGDVETFLAATGLDLEEGSNEDRRLQDTVRHIAGEVLGINSSDITWEDDIQDATGGSVDLVRDDGGGFHLSKKLFDVHYVHQAYDGRCLLPEGTGATCQCRATRMIGLLLTEQVLDQPRDSRSRAHASLMCYLMSHLGQGLEIPDATPAARVDLTRLDHNGVTLLHYAAYSGNTEVVKVLLDHAVPVGIRTSEGKTPLHFAAETGQTAVASILCDAGADVNTLDSWKQSPLFYATFEDHVSVIELLLRRGAEPDIIAKNKTTPRSLAQSPKAKKLYKKIPRADGEVDSSDEDTDHSGSSSNSSSSSSTASSERRKREEARKEAKRKKKEKREKEKKKKAAAVASAKKEEKREKERKKKVKRVLETVPDSDST